MWQLSDNAWLYVVLDAERAGRGLLTLMGTGLDARISALSGRGIETGPPQPGAGNSAGWWDPSPRSS
jgi:hypothetical protein